MISYSGWRLCSVYTHVFLTCVCVYTPYLWLQKHHVAETHKQSTADCNGNSQHDWWSVSLWTANSRTRYKGKCGWITGSWTQCMVIHNTTLHTYSSIMTRSTMSDYSVIKHLLINTAQLIHKRLTTLIDKDAGFWQQGMRDISSDGVNPRKWHR